jgi:hypothetical protein
MLQKHNLIKTTFFLKPKKKMPRHEKVISEMIPVVDMETRTKTLVYCHTNAVRGTRIVHAGSGLLINCILGSNDEDYLFRVKYAVADQLNHTGPFDMFFFTPEEAEKHLKIKVRDSTKQKFHDRLASLEH